MLLEILIGVCLTAVIAYLVETIRMHKAINQIVMLNKTVLETINPMIDPLREVNVFVVSEMRAQLIERFVKTHLIDELKIYLLEHDKIRLLYRKGLAVQKLDIYVHNNEHAIKSVAIEYFDNPFETDLML